MKCWSVSDAVLQSYFVFPSQRETVEKTEECQKDLVMATLLKKNLHVKYLICFIWQRMLLSLGSILNKTGACEWWYYWKHELWRNEIFIFLSETYPRAVLGKHADLIIMNLSNSS